MGRHHSAGTMPGGNGTRNAPNRHYMALASGEVTSRLVRAGRICS